MAIPTTPVIVFQRIIFIQSYVMIEGEIDPRKKLGQLDKNRQSIHSFKVQLTHKVQYQGEKIKGLYVFKIQEENQFHILEPRSKPEDR